jgi:hypothetical protein
MSATFLLGFDKRSYSSLFTYNLLIKRTKQPHFLAEVASHFYEQEFEVVLPKTVRLGSGWLYKSNKFTTRPEGKPRSF